MGEFGRFEVRTVATGLIEGAFDTPEYAIAYAEELHRELGEGFVVIDHAEPRWVGPKDIIWRKVAKVGSI